jgi:hypothetical protein
MTVSTQRPAVQAMSKAVPVADMWPSTALPMEAPKTMSAEAMPPQTAVASISGKARSRFATKLRSMGTSYRPAKRCSAR